MRTMIERMAAQRTRTSSWFGEVQRGQSAMPPIAIGIPTSNKVTTSSRARRTFISLSVTTPVGL